MSEETEYLTIAEYARQAGCTRQTVYAKLNTNLAPYVREKYGKKLIDIRALTEVNIFSKAQRVSEMPVDMNNVIDAFTPLATQPAKKESVKFVKRNDKPVNTGYDDVRLKLILDEQRKIEEASYLYGSLPSNQNSGNATDCLIDVIRGQEELLKEKDKQIKKMQSTINELISMLNDERTYSRQMSNDFNGIARGMLVVNHELLTYGGPSTSAEKPKPKRKRWNIIRFILKIFHKKKIP